MNYLQIAIEGMNEEKEITERMISAWKNQVTDFLKENSMSFEHWLDERNMETLWNETVAKYEFEANTEFIKINNCGVVENESNFTILRLVHKAKSFSIERHIVKFSNGLFADGASNRRRLGYGGWSPSISRAVKNYNKFINEIYADVRKTINGHYKEMPQIRKRLLADLDEQMKHSRFGGLYWTEHGRSSHS
tara:strand:- start:1144 stop:1719 length:576 start_codon:yes stop_codon:yes gene_type:complete